VVDLDRHAGSTFREKCGREDEALIRQAADRFEAIGLSWHAEQSRKVLAGT